MDISISLDPAVGKNLKEYLAEVNAIKGIRIHCDVMRPPYGNRMTDEEFQYVIANAKHPIDIHIMAGTMPSPIQFIDLDDPIPAVIGDAIIIMSVKAGASGQKFNPSALEKARAVRKLNPYVRIIMDGGINPDNIAMVKDAGVDTAVVGNYVYASSDRRATVEQLRYSSDKR